MKNLTLLENNKHLFQVYHFENKMQYNTQEHKHVIAELDTQYDCVISFNNLIDENFTKKYNLSKEHCFTSYDKTIFDKYNNIFVQINIEGNEWEWLSLLNENDLNKISQLVIEFHGITTVSWHWGSNINQFATYEEKIKCLTKLINNHYIIHAHGNNTDRVDWNGLPNILELVYVNKKYFNEIPKLNTNLLPMEKDVAYENRFPDVNLNFSPFVENPFTINIPDKDEYSLDDYINIQEQLVNKLNDKKIENTIEKMYSNQQYTFYNLPDFKYRILRGLKQKIIDISNNLLPTKTLYKIGNGGNHRNCIICCVPLSHNIDNNDDKSRLNSAQQIIKSLEETGFNGHFYLFTGGFPNPTGTEMKYIGVPYCFKIFMMLESQKLGFDKVIWIDSGCYAINNPEDLFDVLYTNDTLMTTHKSNNHYNNMVFPNTMHLLNQINNNQLINSLYIQTIVFGLNLNSELIQNIIKEYYEMVKLGYPFFSIFPEEVVLSSLFNKSEYSHLIHDNSIQKKLYINERIVDETVAKQNGYYFHHKDYSKYKKKYYITFDSNFGRLGNQLFRYITSKLFTFKFQHEYIARSEFVDEDYIIINEDNIDDYLTNNNILNKNIILQGYFQKSELFNRYYNQLNSFVYNDNNNDYWEVNNKKYYAKDYLVHSKHSLNLKSTDIVIHLRLNDFIQYPCKTSDIIPPQYYIETLEKMKITNETIYIICDKLKYDWEFKYIEYFKKWNIILIQKDLFHDIALLRDCNILIHSNSSLCWIISFLSNKQQRYIPYTSKKYMNQNQHLLKINETDTLTYLTQLNHDEVHNLNVNEESVFPLSFCVPDECVVDEIPNKTTLLASLIPGNVSTYTFDKYKEKKYNEMYKTSRFAITKMKGGWDCLRHYEILMNGCIPLFENLKDCPDCTLTTYPKHLNDEAYELYNNWCENEECIEKYNILCSKFLQHTKEYCTTSATAKYFLNNIKDCKNIKNILLITCHSGVNYNRETLWIGLKRYIQSIGGVAVEYEKMPFLYDDFDNFSEHHYYGSNCYTFPKRLQKDDDYNMSETEILNKINDNFWDLIIYGKVGPDEFCNFPYYDVVKTKYNKNKIAFIYGGDEMFNLKITDENAYHVNMFNRCIYYKPYNDYLNYYKQFGTCFVRELEK